MKDKILKVLNNARKEMAKQMLFGENDVDFKELLFQVDEQIREILKENSNEEENR